MDSTKEGKNSDDNTLTKPVMLIIISNEMGTNVVTSAETRP